MSLQKYRCQHREKAHTAYVSSPLFSTSKKNTINLTPPLLLQILCSSRKSPYSHTTMKVDTRSQNHPPGDEEKIMTRKQKAEKQEHEQSPNKKPKSEDNNNNNNGNKSNNKSLTDIVAEFDNFCKTTSQHLSIKQMREILEANNANSSGSDDAVVPRW